MTRGSAMVPVATGLEVKACDVCAAFGDATPKECWYCGFCDAWICHDCGPRTGRRAIAMLIRPIQRMRAQPK